MDTASDVAVVRVGERPTTVADVVRVAHGAPVELSADARERILAARAVVDALVDGETPIYGLNTGLGHMRDQRVSRAVLRDYQQAIVRLHAGGIGPALAAPIVRAAMFVRVVGISLGGAGATLGVAETLTAMLNAGVHPVVPVVGSVGASDLMHMAAVALVAMGEGRAEIGGNVVAGAEALRRAGIEPVRLEPKDGLAVVSANGVAVGHAALVVDRAARTADALDVVAALSLEAVRGNPGVFEPVVAAAKPIAGQVEAAARVRALVSGSRLCRAGGPASVQDPLSFRVVAQVHGALRELVRFARRAVDDELASMDDNPLVVTAEGRIVSNGNFHPMLLALAFDALRPGLAQAGQLSERRSGHLMDVLVSDPDVLADGGAKLVETSGATVLLRYAAAARYTELRQLAEPATLDLPPLDLGVEDHATNAPLTVRRTQEALGVVDDLAAAELMIARSILRAGGATPGDLGAGTQAALTAVDESLADVAPGTAMEDLHGRVRDLLPDAIAAAAGVVV